MSLKHVDLGSALCRVADRRIEEAMREGKFDNLPGTGLPLDLDPMPADEGARITWWAVRLLRKNGCTDLAVKWSRSADTTR